VLEFVSGKIYARSLNGIHLPRFTRGDWSVTAVDSTAEREDRVGVVKGRYLNAIFSSWISFFANKICNRKLNKQTGER
jgi:hypothetical protein